MVEECGNWGKGGVLQGKGGEGFVVTIKGMYSPGWKGLGEGLQLGGSQGNARNRGKGGKKRPKKVTLRNRGERQKNRVQGGGMGSGTEINEGERRENLRAVVRGVIRKELIVG